MKLIILIFISIIFFTGCAVQEPQAPTQEVSFTVKIKDFNDSNIITGNETNSTSIYFDNVETIMEQEKKVTQQIALIFPSSQIGKYALEVINSINSYLLYKGGKQSLEVFDIVTQNEINLENGLKKIKDKNIKIVVAIFTSDFLNRCERTEYFDGLDVFFPIINKNDSIVNEKLDKENLVFGGISYKNQLSKLIESAKTTNLINLYDNSTIGKTLDSYILPNKLKYKREVDDNNGRYVKFLENNKKFNNSVVILNTPIVKSSILLSQIQAVNLNVKQVLSTQLNYTPLLLSLTQKQDRENIILANSIGKIPDQLKEYSLLVSNNLKYSWVNYSSIVGLEYLLTKKLDLFEDLKLIDNQIEYPIRLYNVRMNSFEEIQ